MLKIGPTRITGAVIPDGRPDFDRLCHQVAALAARTPRLQSTFAPFLLWHVRNQAPFEIERHVASLEDPTVTSMEDVEGLLERVRRLDLPMDRSPWLMIAVNATRDNVTPTGMPAILFHFDHSIADGIRALELVTRYPADPKIAAAVDELRDQGVEPPRSPTLFNDLPVDDRILPLPLACVSVGLDRLKAVRATGHDLSDQLIGALDEVLGDDEIFEQSEPRTGKVALVRLTKRRLAVGELGNHVAVVDRQASANDAQASTRRGMLPSLNQEKTTEARQYWMSPFPGSITKTLARQWYAQFDALLTIIPGGRNHKTFADTSVNEVYGVAPFLADIRLNVAVIVYGDRVTLSLLPKSHFRGDKDLLRTRTHDALVAGRGQDRSAA